MPDVVLHEPLDIGENIVDWSGDAGHHVRTDTPRGRPPLRHQKFEHMQRQRDVTRENFRELPIILVERREPRALEARHADDPVMET